MAEVTGFTADRMRIIENTTVVDGEVQGDNLVLLTREGTPIDAGNVRGPQGIQGEVGPVQSVNDQIGAVYSPRIFASKAALDAWVGMPDGAQAFTIDTDTPWVKLNGTWVGGQPLIFLNKTSLDTLWPAAPIGSIAYTTTEKSLWSKVAPTVPGWQATPGLRVFGTKALLDSDWANAPDGAIAEAPTGTFWVRNTGAWRRFSDLGSTYEVENPYDVQFFGGGSIANIGDINVITPGLYAVQMYARVGTDGTGGAVDIYPRVAQANISYYAPSKCTIAPATATCVPLSGRITLTGSGNCNVAISGVLVAGGNVWVGYRRAILTLVQWP